MSKPVSMESVTMASKRPPLRVNPYRRIGLSGNPFQVINDPSLLRQAVSPEMVALADELAVNEMGVIEVLGERGWGKSTLLTLIRSRAESLSQRRWAADYVELNQTRIGRPKQPFAGWTIDEAQRLSGSAQRGLLLETKQAGSRLAIGTHTSLAPLAGEVDVPLRSVQLSAPSVSDLQTMLTQRVAAFAIDPMTTQLSAEAAELAYQHATGNRRMFEELLYEVFCGFAQSGQLPDVINSETIQAAIAAQSWS